MRELSQDAPSLFDAPPSPTYLHAKEFVRWCCSFGSDFRNSPDITNLRYWAQKNKVKMQDREEMEILSAARTMVLNHIGQSVRKAEAKSEAPN
jgi:hypothetical protein